MTSIRLQFGGKFCNANKKKNVDKAGEILKPLCNTDALNNKQRFPLLVSGSSDFATLKHVPLAPLTASKLVNEGTEHTALFTFLHGSFVQEKFIYRQIFVVRSYGIGPDKNVTMETLMNFLQETALNHVSSCGISKNDFGITHEMDLRKLIWVVTRIQVEVERYGKCTWVLMNRETRKLSKIPEEVGQEIVPFYFNRYAIAKEEIDYKKIHKLTDHTAERFRSGIVPRWNDMDVNGHVNNVKYIGWILESMPREVLVSYNMKSMTLEFRRECKESDILESMTSSLSNVIGANNNKREMQYIHMLRLQDDKAELVRARTEWHLKQEHMSHGSMCGPSTLLHF